MRLRHAAAAIAVAMILAPMAAMAQSTTSSDAQSQIQSLLTQIKSLQQQLQTLIQANGGLGTMMHGSSTSSMMGDDRMMAPGQMGKMMCITLNRSLSIGSQGDDVKSLQQMLAQDPENEFSASATGFFGPLTAKAMMKFQQRMGIASSTTGSVGPLTRGFFERQCGKGVGLPGQNSGMDSGHDIIGNIAGTISANNGSNVTVTNKDGKSVTANITASTTIQVWSGTSTPPTMGTSANLTVGVAVMIDGPKNTDGSVNAIHIRVGFPQVWNGPMMQGDDHGGMRPGGMMPTIFNQDTHGNGNDDRPQNW